MSPEQSVGERDLDGRSDLYSLGSVLYEMLGGEPPYVGSTAQAIIAKRFMEPVPRITTLRETVPPAVEAALNRVLAKAPADRFATAAEFTDALAALTPLSPVRMAITEPPGPSIAVLPFANMSADPEDEYFADGITEEIINALAQVPGLKVAARASCFAFKGKREDLRVIAEKLGVGRVLAGAVRKARPRVRTTAQTAPAPAGTSAKRVRVHDVSRGDLEHEANRNDTVILKSSDQSPRLPTYHFAHAVDDHLMRVTLVIRGEEWISSVPLHLQLYEALGFEPMPSAHIPPLSKTISGGKSELSTRSDPSAPVDFSNPPGSPRKAVPADRRAPALTRPHRHPTPSPCGRASRRPGRR